MAKSSKVLRRITPVVFLASALLLFLFGKALAAYSEDAKDTFENCCGAANGTFDEVQNGGLHCDLPNGGGFSAYDSDGDGQADKGEGWCVNGKHENHSVDPSCSALDPEIRYCLVSFL